MTISLEWVAITLSVVALAITVIGFFASLSFYRHGVDLQRKADSVLTKIDNRVALIQESTMGIINRLLDHFGPVVQQMGSRVCSNRLLDGVAA